MDFIQYTPTWLVTLMADGLLGVLYFVPSIIGLVCAAWLCFRLVDMLISFVDTVLLRRFAKKAAISDDPLGALPTRAHFWSFRVVGLVLKAWVGLPAFYVLNLMMSSKPQDAVTLKALLSGYSWQSAALSQLPVSSLLQLPKLSAYQYATEVLIVCVFLTCNYVYWYKGFEITGRIRAVADTILSRLPTTDHGLPQLKQALLTLRITGWTPEECKAAYWFLIMVNLRIRMKIREYQTVSPAGYGLFKTATSLGIVSLLTILHPIVSGLYLATTMPRLKKLYSTARIYRRKLNQLPETIRAQVGS